MKSYSNKAQGVLFVFITGLLLFTLVLESYGQSRSNKDNLDYAVLELLQKYEDKLNLLANQPDASISFDGIISERSEVLVFNTLNAVDTLNTNYLSHTEELTLFDDFINSYRVFFRKSYDPISKSGSPKVFDLVIDGSVDSKKWKNYKIWSIPISQTIRYRGKMLDFRKTGYISKTIWYTIMIPEHPVLIGQGARIIRISKNKYNFNPFKPEKIEISFQYT